MAITTHRKAPVAPVTKAKQWLQPRSTELATIVDKIIGAVGFVALLGCSVVDFLSACAQFTAAMPPELERDSIKATLMDIAFEPPTKRRDAILRGAPGIPVPEALLLATDKCFLEMSNMRAGTEQLMELEAVMPGAIGNLGASLQRVRRRRGRRRRRRRRRPARRPRRGKVPARPARPARPLAHPASWAVCWLTQGRK